MKIKIKQIARDKKGWSLYRLALEANMPKNTIYSWANRRTQPSYANIDLLCTILGCSIDDLFEAETALISDKTWCCRTCGK